MTDSTDTRAARRQPIEHGFTDATYFQLVAVSNALNGLGILFEGVPGRPSNGISHVEHLAPTLTCLSICVENILGQIEPI